jgi:predicted nucleotidyltransferase component of viral defense system
VGVPEKGSNSLRIGRCLSGDQNQVVVQSRRSMRGSSLTLVYSGFMDLAEIRRLVIVAMFSDDVLFGRLVLKGGNAISLVYGFGTRGSLDVDFSIDGDFDDLEDTARRIERALAGRFRTVGYVLFDYNFTPRPSVVGTKGDRWGGYRAQFKIIERDKYEKLGGDLEAARREATIIGPLNKRNFTVDLSKWEFCNGKVDKELHDYTIYVYTPVMLVLEKIRAICQQMAEYQIRSEKSARARDFYDIYVLISGAEIDLAAPEVLELAKHIFAAKDVPLNLISKLPDYREFHRPDWPSVQDTVRGELQPFDNYFEFVLLATRALEPLWKI